ncbi:Solvent efflux pump periplasmic linker SrpA precursor [Marinomonas spartinae]|uniref:Solvent efflux pump periplasmic linker SrpA n=1 Tax=Marinomonas spartinae TaxID=1792290 RepID=A0A1A8T4J5_9GAMM|nr:efflux RND transporter periplasmic adaptor subunit [Marinomonas spartinae]SBS27135.1 Solvent efflux pump periplasmic linker SrpA precursor [Marinomonas spartinae]SBS35960.1 Solvent efflux pump periplasmic linker SrpA precursor [Marinomonas spartinae]
MTHQRNKLCVLSILLATTVILTACSDQKDQESMTQNVIQPVKLMTIDSSQVVNIRRFPAELKASEEANLAFRVGGQLTSINVVAGQRVKKGELLAALDPKDYKLKVELAKANQQLAQVQFNRIQTMLKRNATSKSQFDEIKANLAQANNALETAKNQLSYTKLYAPFDGVISSTSTKNFQYVNATQTILHIQNIDNLDVQFQVPENLVTGIKSTRTGYQPTVILDTPPHTVFKGAYKEHKTQPDTSTMAYDVTLHLLRNGNNSQTLLPGMTANVELDLNKLNGTVSHIVVPVEAVLRHENTQTGNADSIVWVYHQDKQSLEARKVTLGKLQGNKIEITSGLKPKEQIVVAGVNDLTPDMKVRPLVRERGL